MRCPFLLLVRVAQIAFETMRNSMILSRILQQEKWGTGQSRDEFHELDDAEELEQT